ncbi:MAG: HlyD family efflux transporter periplasmic adaptor subunit [Oscillospiraceae bacterium]|jgi:HlyD family secretion protein|nr:HlyD family efflux transporter periplasmic adaptor subunit [Oscillospiraceae bacterium]
MSVNAVPADAPPETAPPQKRGTGRRWIKRAVILLIIAAAVFAVQQVLSRMRAGQPAAAAEYITETAERRDVVSTLTGNGALTPADSYTVTTLIEGEILSADFEEGDTVEKDAVLYTVDNSDTSNSIERAELSLTQAQTNYSRKLENLDKLRVTASVTGTVTQIDVEAGDSVSAGQTVAYIVDSSVMTVTLPFLSDDAAGFYIGQDASVTLDGSFETLAGIVTKISGSDSVLTGNSIVRQVTIETPNPGALSTSQTATAEVGGASCGAPGVFAYKGEASVVAEVSGKVESVLISEGGFVTKGQTAFQLTSDALTDEVSGARNSVRDAEIALESQYDQLDAYEITSPISGTVIEKLYKTGDTLGAGKALCTVYDLSYLTFTMNIDELDIMKIKAGQSVTVTADAVSGARFDGVVTKINIQGSTSGGVTTYPVTVRIDDAGDLLPGMNVDAEIVTGKAENAVTVPIAAVLRGNRVLVKTDAPPETGGDAAPRSGGAALPEGFAYVTVVTGMSDESYIEIKEGVSEGDTVSYAKTSSGDGEFTVSFGAMPGGAVREAAPGAVPGGAPPRTGSSGADETRTFYGG